MSTEKIHTARVASWPEVNGDLTDREAALKARDTIRRRIEDEAYTAGCTQVRIENAWGDVLDAYPLDTQRFVVPVGQLARFPSRWASGGDRIGTVVERSATRYLIEYRFNNGAKAAPKTVTKPVEPAVEQSALDEDVPF
mgnify:CR=1 FL=1